MSLTIKKLLIFTLSSFILVVLVLYDPRSSVLGEPFTLTFMAISIAISYLVYDVDGFIGLREVYESLSNIPHASNYFSKYYSHLGGFIFDFANVEQIKQYNETISLTISESKNLVILDKENVHTFQNNIGYVLYIILSFILFGINLKSISILFLSILIFSSVVFMLNFYKNNLYFFLLQTFLFALVIAIIENYGGSVQIASMNNLRFLSILCIIPVLHLSLVFLNKNRLNFKSLLSATPQLLILVFICQVRETAMWGFIFLTLFYLLWICVIGLQNFQKNKINIFSMISSIILFLIIFNFSNATIKKNLALEYKDKSVITKHMFWHNLFIGMATYPKIHENYVCSDIKYKDLYEVKNIPCGVYSLKYPGKSELYKNIFYYQPLDNFGIYAAINYINEKGLNEQLGINNKNNLAWSINWPLYEEILKKLYFEILKNNPLEFWYMNLILKPLKFLLEFVKFIFYFFNSFNINFVFIFLIFICSIFLQYFTIVKIKIRKELVEIKNSKRSYLIESIILLMFLASSAPSIIFYPSQQSGLPECVVILLSLIIFYLKRKFERKI